MSDSPAMPAARGTGAGNGEGAGCAAGGNHSKSMHDGVPVWYDCCSCEAEPYWAETEPATATGAPGSDN